MRWCIVVQLPLSTRQLSRHQQYMPGTYIFRIFLWIDSCHTSSYARRLLIHKYTQTSPHTHTHTQSLPHHTWNILLGIFHNEAQTALAWVNEEDHCRIISMELGGDIPSVFSRFCKLSEAIKVGIYKYDRQILTYSDRHVDRARAKFREQDR